MKYYTIALISVFFVSCSRDIVYENGQKVYESNDLLTNRGVTTSTQSAGGGSVSPLAGIGNSATKSRDIRSSSSGNNLITELRTPGGTVFKKYGTQDQGEPVGRVGAEVVNIVAIDRVTSMWKRLFGETTKALEITEGASVDKAGIEATKQVEKARLSQPVVEGVVAP